MVELHAEHGVARLAERVVDGRVRLRAGVRLHVHVLGAEQRPRPLDRERLDDVHVLAAAVVALAGVALGVLVRQHRALAVEHRLRHEVLGGDHLERRLLPPELGLHLLGDLGIDLGDGLREVVGRQLAHLRAKLPKKLSDPSGRHRTFPHDPDVFAAQVDHGRRRPRQLAPVDLEVDPLPDARIDVLEPPRIRPAGRVGARLEHRDASRPRAAAGQARGSRARRPGSP